MNKDIVWHNHRINKTFRSKQKGQKPCLLWFTGLSGAGKSTVAGIVEQKLATAGKHTYLLDGDNVRHGLNKDLGFKDEDRVENIRRIGEMSKLFVDCGIVVLSAFISPFERDRKMVRDLLEEGEFIEVFCDTPLAICEQRDPKGLYKKARAGVIKNFTGIDSEYEAPARPEIHLVADGLSAEELADQVLNYLEEKNYFFKVGSSDE